MNENFKLARERVTAQAAAERYGLQPTRGGYICCPFHGEKTASLKFYPDGSYYCFGCQRGGDAITFTAELYHMTRLNALRKLNEDFCLGLELDKSPDRADIEARKAEMRAYKREQAKRTDFEIWREAMLIRVNAAYRRAREILDSGQEPKQGCEAALARAFERLGELSDILGNSEAPTEEIIQIYRERGKISRWLDKLSGIPTNGGNSGESKTPPTA